MKDYRVIFTRIGSVVLGLTTLIIFDDMSDPMTGFGDGVFGVLTPLAVGLGAASFLLFGLAPMLETLVIKAGKPRLARAIRPGITLIDATAAVPFVALGLMFAGAHVNRLFGG